MPPGRRPGILALIFAFAFASYVQRNSISVAAERKGSVGMADP